MKSQTWLECDVCDVPAVSMLGVGEASQGLYLLLLLQNHLIFLVQHLLQGGHLLLQLGNDNEVVGARRVQGEVRRKTAAENREWLSSQPLLGTEVEESPHRWHPKKKGSCSRTRTAPCKVWSVTCTPALNATGNVGSTHKTGQQCDKPSCIRAQSAGTQGCYGCTSVGICSNQMAVIYFQTKELRTAIRELMTLYVTTQELSLLAGSPWMSSKTFHSM